MHSPGASASSSLMYSHLHLPSCFRSRSHTSFFLPVHSAGPPHSPLRTLPSFPQGGHPLHAPVSHLHFFFPSCLVTFAPILTCPFGRRLFWRLDFFVRCLLNNCVHFKTLNFQLSNGSLL